MPGAASPLRVGIGSLGAIGSFVARALTDGLPGLTLAAVAARDEEKAMATLGRLGSTAAVASLERLAELCDIVVECGPADVYDRIARPAIAAGRTFVTMSSGALLTRADLIERARHTGARIIVPSGGLAGIDGLLGAGLAAIETVKLVTFKPPGSFRGAPYLGQAGISLEGLTEPLLIFSGSARAAAAAFPANANVAATLSLAGIGPDRTQVEMWAVPELATLSQRVEMAGEACRLTIDIESYPLPDNPRTGSLTPRSLIAALRKIADPLAIAT